MHRLRTIGAVAAALAMLGTSVVSGAGAAVHAAPAPVGQGFTVTPSDLAFILKQIKIAERHSASVRQEIPKKQPIPPLPPLTISPPNPDPVGDPEYCSALVGPDPDQVPNYLTSYGLRTVDGSCNNLIPGGQTVAQADQPFPRLVTPIFNAAEPITASLPVGPPGPTSYNQKLAGNVVIDSQPRVISNLIVDQTSTNPAAVAAAGFPVRTQHDPGVVPCDTVAGSNPPVDVKPLQPLGCVPAHQTLFIPNVTTNVGLSPPYNSLFTFFGQFFDHGLDQTLKSGGTVFVPLQADDPLVVAGPDGIPGNGDEVPPSQAFMVLTRAQNQPGPDGVLGTADDIQNTNNSDTPWVDQSQTYASHASHQVFLREYVDNKKGDPVSTGKLLGGIAIDDPITSATCSTAETPCYNDGAATAGGLSTWAATKKQAADLLGLKLEDKDVTNIPMIATDPYGMFTPGLVTKLPQYVTAHGLVEGCRVIDVTAGLCTGGPVPVPADVLHFDTPFLTDIAHNADPSPQDTDNNPATPPVAPVPDADLTASADFASQIPGTYDDELLNDHFTCGDGRCNENIALSAIHQVFHSEHDRLVDDIENVLLNDTSPSGLLAVLEWQSGSGGVLVVPGDPAAPTYWNGERIFQAARFINEMEYQHMVFEEFARKVQPAIKVFEGYNSDINAAIPAEFASAVYRFGHSMLDETVARTNPDGTDNSTPLLHAFLNPPEYFNAHGTCDTPPCSSSGMLTPQQAAGSIVMGSSDQVGNELDEFVTETLRNNLLGLPLDLATLNLTRARDVGIPPLNDFRRQLFAQTHDGQLAPYTSWSDFGQHLKHPESLINFVAAYGLHPSITAATTLDAKRAAARAIVNPLPGDVPPADAADFMFSTGAWASTAGVTNTGLDGVDLWVGGLAEVTNLNGGLLGSTFNYVFQLTMENLQDGDRFYYLARTAGMNLLSQLEGNSFAEIIERNTDGTNSLKADAFATADCKFQLANLDGTAAGFVAHGATVADDLTTTDCDESLLLQRKPDGTIQYRAVNSVNPVGINSQSVYNGTSGVDRIAGGNDNDTFWGGEGNDIIQGSGGDDVALGGDGNDIITDSSGIDTEKGGPGNDALDGGPGNDLLLGGDGQDFLNGGAGDNTEFGGPGNDFIIGGTGADIVFGDGGDDWIQGGLGTDLLQGDHGAPFFDDPAQVAPGNDIFVGQPGDNSYQAEGGDDLMSQNAAVDRNLGDGGFDWAFHQYDTVAANDDMNINNNLAGSAQPIIVTRDTWQETEADSGYDLNDVIKGTNLIPGQIGGVGTSGCDALDQAGVDRIAGLNALVTTFPRPLQPIVDRSPGRYCPLNDGLGSGSVWAEGDILIGGRGSDTIEGRGGNDIIDGDRFLQTRISVRNPFDPSVEIGSTDLMEHSAVTGNFGPGTTNMTLQQAVFAGLVNPRFLVAVREIITPTAAETAADTDTAVFSGPQTDYAISTSGDATIVADASGAARDGTDTLRNIEQLSFCNGTIDPAGSCSVPRTTVQLANLPSVGLSASSLTFPTLDPAPPGQTATQTLTLTNRGGANLTVSGSSIVADDTGSFKGAPTCNGAPVSLPAVLVPGADCTIVVTFTPRAPGPLTAQLSIATNVGSPILVPLTGTGLGAPTIAQVSPASVTLGATITITGTDLATTSHVTIAGFDAAFTRVDVTTVTAPVPEAVTPASNVPVVVTTAIGTASGHVTVTARPPVLPVVTNVAPASVTLGATITITGTDLATTSHVTIGNVNAPITFVNDTTVTATVPDTVTPASNVPVVVTTLTGSSTGHVTVTARPVVLPVVTNVAPTSVTLGATITITGTDLANATNVTIGGVDAPFTPVNATTVTATVPDTVVPAASVPVVVTTPTGSSSGHVTVTARPEVPPVVPPAVAAVLSPVEPFRLFDTRPGELGMRDVGKSKVDESHRLDVRVTGLGGIPLAGVAAVSLNVTVADAEASGYVTVFPCGEQPVVSSVNFVAGQVVANAVLAPVSADGRVCFYSNVPTNLIVDVNGWYATGTGFNSVAPARVFDTRAGQDGTLSVPKAKVGNGYVLDVVLPGTAGIPPSGVAAVSLNVTVDGPEASGFVTVFPCGEQPVVSSVNFTAGQTVANAVITPLSANGTVCFFSNVPTDLVVDVNGWFATGAGFNRVAPARVFDTRAGQDGVVNVPKAKIGDGYVLDVPFTNLAGLTPAGGVSAVSLNVTVDGGEGSGFVTVFPCGDQPLVSSVNFVAGQIVANAVTTAVSSSGHVCFFSSVPTDLVVDMNAWFAATQP